MNETTAVESVVPGQPRQGWADGAGMIASIGCAIHCAAMPLVLAYLPLFGLEWLAGNGFHRWMAGVCLVLAGAAFVPGWHRHRSLRPAMWGIAGLLLVTTAAFAMEPHCCAAHSTSEGNLAAVPVCYQEECAHCESELQYSAEVPASADAFAVFTALLTPLGGVLLVVGHISNHRQRCHCQQDQCCLDGRKT